MSTRMEGLLRPPIEYASALAYVLLAVMMVVVTFFFKRSRTVYA